MLKNDDTCTDQKKKRILYKFSVAVPARTTFTGGLVDTEMCTKKEFMNLTQFLEVQLCPSKLNVNSCLL